MKNQPNTNPKARAIGGEQYGVAAKTTPRMKRIFAAIDSGNSDRMDKIFYKIDKKYFVIYAAILSVLSLSLFLGRVVLRKQVLNQNRFFFVADLSPPAHHFFDFARPALLRQSLLRD